MNKKIPDEEYKKILENIPVCCVDLVVSQNKKVLLVKRKKEPEKNKWWFPGGRIYKNEKLENAVLRKAFEETGLNVKIIKKIGCYEYFSDKSVFDSVKTGTHSLAICFVVKPTNSEIKIDETNSDFKWINSLDEDLEPYVKQILKDSGVFQ